MKRTRTGLLAFIVVFSTVLIVSLIFTLGGRFATQGESSTASSSKSSSRSVSSSKSAVSNTQSQFSVYEQLREEAARVNANAQKLKENLMKNQTYKINIDVLEKDLNRQLTDDDWWYILDLIAQDSRYSLGFGDYGIDPSAPPNPYTPKDSLPNTYYNKYFHITYPKQISLSTLDEKDRELPPFLFLTPKNAKLFRNFDAALNHTQLTPLFSINSYYIGGVCPDFSFSIYGKLKSASSNQILPEDIMSASEFLTERNKEFQVCRPVTLNNQTFTYIVFNQQEYVCFVKDNIVFTIILYWSHSIFEDPAGNAAYYTRQDETAQKMNRQMIETFRSLTFH